MKETILTPLRPAATGYVAVKPWYLKAARLEYAEVNKTDETVRSFNNQFITDSNSFHTLLTTH